MYYCSLAEIEIIPDRLAGVRLVQGVHVQAGCALCEQVCAKLRYHVNAELALHGCKAILEAPP